MPEERGRKKRALTWEIGDKLNEGTKKTVPTFQGRGRI